MRILRLGNAEAQAGFDPRSPLYKAGASNFTQPEMDLGHGRVLGRGSALGQLHESEQRCAGWGSSAQAPRGGGAKDGQSQGLGILVFPLTHLEFWRRRSDSSVMGSLTQALLCTEVPCYICYRDSGHSEIWRKLTGFREQRNGQYKVQLLLRPHPPQL